MYKLMLSDLDETLLVDHHVPYFNCEAIKKARDKGVKFVVATGSMVPKYNVGDVLISKEIPPEEIKVGDDIVYTGKEGSFKDKVVTHQVIFIEKDNENYRIKTKGIANTGEDPEITQEQVMGKIIYKFKILTFMQKLVANNYIFYFVVFVPIVLITYRQIRRATLSVEDEEEDDNNKE